MARALMFQGTGSDVGKSVIVAGLARLLARRSLAVRPFKPQNMSNNAAATPDGGEIGRAQALQARAAGCAPTVHMKPVLLKPETETGAQVIVQGRRVASVRARDYAALKPRLMTPVLDSFARLAAEADVVLVEGAGSAAEINLRAHDIANMGFALAAGVPVVLVADIDRGGVIANLVGTHAVIAPEERAAVRGFLVNRFRGDVRLFDGGVAAIEARTGWPSMGVVPWFDAARRLPAEDVLGLAGAERPDARVRVVVPRLPRIANFDDLDPLRLEPAVSVEIVDLDRPLPPAADLVLLPGSKATIADLAALRAAGWGIDIAAHVRRGGRVLGLCGGYQMLGRTVADPDGIEGPPAVAEGLGLLAVDTVLAGPKTTRLVRGRASSGGHAVSGYEIHMGRTDGPDCARPLVTLEGGVPDGATSPDGLVAGSYVHGLFAEDGFRAAFLAAFGAGSSVRYDAVVEETLDALADHLAAAVDVDGLLAAMAPVDQDRLRKIASTAASRAARRRAARRRTPRARSRSAAVASCRPEGLRTAPSTASDPYRRGPPRARPRPAAIAASGHPALGDRCRGASASTTRTVRASPSLPPPAASPISTADRRAGTRFAPSSSRAAAQPKARCRSSMWPIIESAVFSIL